MKTGSLRARLILTTLALLAIVLAAVVTAVTLAYRARLDSDLRGRLAGAAVAVERAGSAGFVKPLIPGLALEGIALRFAGSPSEPARPAGRSVVKGAAPGIQTDMTTFARCMRSHGVPNWPAPTLDQGRAIFDPQAAGIDTDSARISAEMQHCERVFPASIGVPPGAGQNP